MKPAYTKGPWVIQLQTQASPLIKGGPERIDGVPVGVVAEVYPIGDEVGRESMANAHLIAAAPLLLKALDAVCNYYVDVNSPFADNDERRVVNLADKAMALATGKA